MDPGRKSRKHIAAPETRFESKMDPFPFVFCLLFLYNKNNYSDQSDALERVTL